MPSDQVIAARYRLDEQIGSGGMGIVWRSTDLELGRVVALKQSQDGDHGQIRREARIGAGLHHPNVVTVFDTVVDGDARWLVMEYLPSRSLAEVIQADGPLPPITVARIGAQLANALAAMHELQMVHRDIKPGNVLITEDGTAKLTDLGIARWADVTVTGGSQPAGTPGFASPEVVDGHEAEPPSDVYSLGATLFAAIEGVSPTGSGEQGPYVQMRRAAAGELEPMRKAGPLEPVLRDLLATRPAARPSARGVKEKFDEITGDSTPLATMPGRRSGKGKLAVGAAALVVAIGAAVTIYVVGQSGESAAPANAGTVGDGRTADPCKLLNIGTAKSFGTMATLDTEYGEFMRCGVLIKQSNDDQDLVDARVEITKADDYPTAPHTPGQLGVVERFHQEGDECRRVIRLADDNQLTIAARHKEDRPAPLCAVADALASDAYTVVARGPVPRRTEPFPGASLGNVDACALLTPDEIADATAVGWTADKFPPEPGVGNFNCWWGADPVEVDVILHRDYPLSSPGDGDPIKIGGYDAFMENQPSGDDQYDACVVEVIHRGYQKNAGWNTDWQETAQVIVETQEDIPLDRLCAKSVELAERMVTRLPKP